jgi:hypothetical protein
MPSRREPDLIANNQMIADLRAAAPIARSRGADLLAALFDAAATAAEHTPVAARFGIPEQVVARDVDEELRWAPVLVRMHTMAKGLLAAADPRVDLDAVLAR